MLPLTGNDLRAKLPSSRTRVVSRVAPFDAMWAGISPVLAFFVRDGALHRIDAVVPYCTVALVVSLIVFQWFRISSPLPRFFSLRDALTVATACLTTVALTTVILFIFTRLDDAPRSIPIIHFLILGFGLIGVRTWSRLSGMRRGSQNGQPRCEEIESVMVIGATRLAWFFSTMVEELSSAERRIVAILDERPQLINRTLNGYSVIGIPENLSTIIDEYAAHGVEINRIVVAEDPENLTEKTRNELRSTCDARNIPIEWLHKIFLTSHAKSSESSKSFVADLNFVGIATARPYWKIKRLIDIVTALAMIITFAPVTILVAALVLIDVGVPIVFWQQRVGYLGRPLRVYKFRTMRSLFDHKGQLNPEAERLSLLGRLLRRNHLDEIPQLFNILTGGMSLTGPRPLLPVDQPSDIRLRLQVRPGLTGLAQISGGTSLSVDEKSAIDEWYIRHASLWLDIKIILRTIWVMVRGNPRNYTQISVALAERQINAEERIWMRPAENVPTVRVGTERVLSEVRTKIRR
jgi:lipopolysaccharide/colanic/teichoic acid biosynthesis glycosyltransferase